MLCEINDIILIKRDRGTKIDVPDQTGQLPFTNRTKLFFFTEKLTPDLTFI